MGFMISKETENVQSSEEIENAFRAIASGERPFVTKEELYAVSVPSNLSKVPSGIVHLLILRFLPEPHKRNGGLLHFPNETVRGSKDRSPSTRSSGLCRLYSSAFSELEATSKQGLLLLRKLPLQFTSL